MKTFTQILSIVFFVSTFISTTYSQVKKTPAPQKAAPATSLNPDDYKYYVIVRRNYQSSTNPNYTLSNQGYGTSSINLSQSGFIVVDSRTMKELSWWPEGTTYSMGKFLYVLSNASIGSYGKILYKFTSEGKLIFRKPLRWQSPTGEIDVQIAGDWKHVYTIFNNDAWVGDFNMENALIGNMHQVTQSGLMSFIQGSYMKGNTLLLSNYIINTDDGVYQKCGSPEYISPTSGDFFYTKPNYSPRFNTSSAIWSFKNRKKIMEIIGRENAGWINRGQTKILNYIYDRNGNIKNTQILDLNSFPNSRPVNWSSKLFVGDIFIAASPNDNNFFASGQSNPNKDYSDSDEEFIVYNTQTLGETHFSINMVAGLGTLSQTRWTDDNHILFSLKEPRMMLNKRPITTETQGTYIVDIKSKEIKRLLPTFIKDYNQDFIPLNEAGKVVFEANNYLYSSRTDGSELVQITKIPSVYKLASVFIDQFIK